jgi:hypothetical protein
MDEVSTKVKLVDSATAAPGLVVTLPRSEVDEALAGEDEPELLLDVVRATNGDKEQRRVAAAWERADLEKLVGMTSGEGVSFMIDPESLEQAFDADVEAHGVRETALALSIAAVTAGGVIGGAQGAVDQYGGGGTSAADPYAQIETVRADRSATADPMAGIENVRAERQAPEATPDPYAAIEQVRGASPADPDTAIENVRAVGRQAPEPAADPYTGIENVRAGAPAAGDPYAGIENVRAQPRSTEGGGGGISVSAPSPEAAAGLAGAAVLTIAGAAFALRKRREPRPA